MRPSCSPPFPADGGSRPGLLGPVVCGVLLSLVLHGLVGAGIWMFAGSESCPVVLPAALLEMDLAGLGGAGGGDGASGGGDDRPQGQAPPAPDAEGREAASEPAPEAPAREEQPVQPDAPSEEPAVPAQTAPERAPEPPPPVAPPPKPAPPPRKTRLAPRLPAAQTAEKTPAPDLRQPSSQAAPGLGSHGAGPGRGLGAGDSTGGATGEGRGAGQGPAEPGRGEYGEARFGDGEGPRFVKLVQPRYPPRAKEARKEGGVLLRLTIDAMGRLQQASVVRSGGADLDEAALEAVRQSSYFPATSRGRHVGCRALLYIHFKLSSRN